MAGTSYLAYICICCIYMYVCMYVCIYVCMYGAPTPTIADPSSNTTLFRYVNDPIFKSIRPYFYRISENARKRESCFNTPATQCTVCMQFFTKLNQHTSNSDSITGCYNVARLRMYICHRKNIPLPTNTLSSALAHPTVPKLESYLMELN